MKETMPIQDEHLRKNKEQQNAVVSSVLKYSIEGN